MSENIEQAVRSRYGSVALSDLSSNQGGVRAVAEAFGYTPEELASIPAEANMGSQEIDDGKCEWEYNIPKGSKTGTAKAEVTVIRVRCFGR